MSPEDAVLVLERDSEVVDVLPFAGGQVAIYSRRSPERDSPNQDAAALIPYGAEDRGVLLVADGAGGSRGGAQASSMAVHELCAELEQGVKRQASLREAVLDGIEAADREIQALAIGAATTLALVTIEGQRVRPFHVGDSQIMVLGQRGRVKLLTTSHSPVGYAESSGYLDEMDAIQHEDRHYVSNVLGTPEMTIEMGPTVELSSMDTVLVASDGLFDNLTKPEIIEELRAGDLGQACGALVAACRERMRASGDSGLGKPDDLTLLAYRLA